MGSITVARGGLLSGHVMAGMEGVYCIYQQSNPFEYLARIPWYVKAVDFDAKLIITLWNASHVEVWYCGESFVTSLQKALFCMIALTLSLALVSIV